MSSNNNKDALLFDDDSPEVEAERGGGGGGFQVNKRFAKDYQSRKQQEELRNHIPGNSDSSSDDESEDEDGELLTPGIDVSILKTINALRNKDESIYNPESKFFDDSTTAADDVSSSKEKSGHVKKHFKDVLREQILDQIEEEEGRKSTNNSNLDEQPKDRLEYDAEQKDLRSAFLDNDDDDDDADEDDILVVKTKAQPVSNDELEKEYETMRKSNIKGSLKDPHGEVEDGDRFLLDFLKNKKWVDKDDDDDDDAMNDNEPQQRDNDDDSIDDVHRADDFESKYNFRFEEAQSQIKSGADYSVMAYARSGTMDTLRRKDDTRRTKRLDRQERKAAERKIKEEQLRRLKNAKREEMEMKLKEIKKVMGAVQDVDEDAMMKLMEGDYDPEKFEKLMQDQYGDDFYEEEEKQWKSDGDVRDSLLQDEDGNQLVGEDDADGGLYDNQEDEEVEEEQGEEEYYGEDEETGGDPDDELPPAESKLEQRLQTKLQEELYKLDYEDIVAGMPTRFKYRKVEKNSFGLSTHEILLARDSTLKNFVSLKKIAPYRDDGEHAVGHKARRRFRDMLEEDLAEMAEKEGIVTKEHNKELEEEDGGGGKKKRRRQKKGKKEKSEEAAVLEEEVPADDVEKETEDDDNDEGGKKKRRKKNGKKKEKSEDTEMPPADDAEKETDDNDNDEGAKKKKRKKKGKKGQNNNNDAEEETNADDAPTAVESSTKEKSSEEKTKKKNKKMLQKLKKKKLIEGVSASRLEAYGL